MIALVFFLLFAGASATLIYFGYETKYSSEISGISSSIDCYTRSNQPASCQNSSTCCAYWDGSTCWEGTYNPSNNVCTPNNVISTSGLQMIITGSILGLLSLISLGIFVYNKLK